MGPVTYGTGHALQSCPASSQSHTHKKRKTFCSADGWDRLPSAVKLLASTHSHTRKGSLSVLLTAEIACQALQCCPGSSYSHTLKGELPALLADGAGRHMLCCCPPSSQ
eukprot:1158808-Pelagomonas_calceolata.AAC.4